MSKVLIGGYGRIGQTVSNFMDKLGHEISIVDPIFSDINEKTKFDCYDTWDAELISSNDIVISCTQSCVSLYVASLCNKLNVMFIDISGDVTVERQLRNKEWNNACFCGVGLSPGFTNIIAWSEYRRLVKEGHIPTDVKMYCGGIAANRSANFLGYIPTWSIDGLFKNYTQKVECLENGKIVHKEPCSSYHKINIFDNDFETFLTSGGLSHSVHDFQNTTVKTCQYYTLRWPNHLATIEFLMYLSETESIHIDDLKDILLNYLTNNTKNYTDCVIIGVDILYDKDKHRTIKSKIGGNKKFTAMQIATAGPTAAIADMLVKDKPKGFITYKDLNYEEFENNLSRVYSLSDIKFTPAMQG